MYRRERDRNRVHVYRVDHARQPHVFEHRGLKGAPTQSTGAFHAHNNNLSRATSRTDFVDGGRSHSRGIHQPRSSALDCSPALDRELTMSYSSSVEFIDNFPLLVTLYFNLLAPAVRDGRLLVLFMIIGTLYLYASSCHSCCILPPSSAPLLWLHFIIMTRAPYPHRAQGLVTVG